MCDNLLIDLTGWNEPVKEEAVVEEPALVEANSFKGPYDPFDSVEKEACLMALKLPIKTEKPEIETQDFDQDLNNEPPPDALELDESYLKSPETRLAKPNAALCHNSPPHNTIKLFRDVMLDSLQMIAAESPIKFVEDEPQQVPISITGPTDYECSNAEFEERLKNLRIAMSGTVTDKPASNTPQIATEQIVRKAKHGNVDRSTHGGYVEDLLILKSLVCQHVEVSKRKEFDLVIERLRNTFNALTSSVEATKQPAVDSPQASYTRQATFDMQLQQQQQRETAECVAGLGAGRKVDAFPDAMTCSSATYDGESVATVPLPIIDSEKPKALPEICVQKPDSYMTNQVNENLMLQINELLERHNLQTNEELQLKQECDHNNETKTGGSASTVILIVNSTATSNQIPSCIVHPTTNTTITPAPVVVAPVVAASGTSAASSRASTYRRRSSSLSIHDKAKPAERTKPFVNQNVPPKELLTVDSGNAMKSFRQRRNSYSLHSTAAKAGAGSGASLGVGKSAAINESTTPTKAGIPTKRVVPRVKPLNVSTAANSHHLNTPMPSKTKPAGGQMFCTSTPMPQMRAQPRRSLRPVSSYSNVSTSIQSSYSKRPSQ